jgi:hypothetical protein
LKPSVEIKEMYSLGTSESPHAIVVVHERIDRLFVFPDSGLVIGKRELVVEFEAKNSGERYLIPIKLEARSKCGPGDSFDPEVGQHVVRDRLHLKELKSLKKLGAKVSVKVGGKYVPFDSEMFRTEKVPVVQSYPHCEPLEPK